VVAKYFLLLYFILFYLLTADLIILSGLKLLHMLSLSATKLSYSDVFAFCWKCEEEKNKNEFKKSQREK
jgi:hypothetical protein